MRSRGFGVMLSSVTFSAQDVTRPVSYYAFFKGWLLLSQPPGCLSDVPLPFPLSMNLGTLADDLGSYPLDPGPSHPESDSRT